MRRQQTDILRILIIVMAALIAVVAIGGGIFLFSASKKLKGIELTPDFAGEELEVGTQYSFTVNTSPKKASLKKLKCETSDSSCSFEYDEDAGKAILTTGMNEGSVTLYVESKDIKSSVLNFNIIDSVARAQAEAAAAAEAEAAAQAAAEAEAAAAAAAEAEAAAKYVKCVGDDVRVRAQNNTDCDILGKAKNGEVFEKVEDVDDWTHILYKGQDAYMKTEFLTEISEEEAQAALANPVEEAQEPASETSEPKKEEKKTEANNEATTTQSKAEAEAKAAEAKAAEAAAAAAEAEALAAAQAAAVAAAAATPAYTIDCADGQQSFTAEQYNFIKGFWSYTDDWTVYAHKHTKSELIAICQVEGGIY